MGNKTALIYRAKFLINKIKIYVTSRTQFAWFSFFFCTVRDGETEEGRLFPGWFLRGKHFYVVKRRKFYEFVEKFIWKFVIFWLFTGPIVGFGGK